MHSAFAVVQELPCDDPLAHASPSLDELHRDLLISLGIKCQLDETGSTPAVTRRTDFGLGIQRQLYETGSALAVTRRIAFGLGI